MFRTEIFKFLMTSLFCMFSDSMKIVSMIRVATGSIKLIFIVRAKTVVIVSVIKQDLFNTLLATKGK